MDLKQSNSLRALKEVQKFLDEHSAELPGVSETGMRKKFDATVAEIEKLAATQTSADLAAMAATRKVAVLTEDLTQHHMKHVARIATVALPPGPELEPLSQPKANVTGERLAARARGMATQAQKFEKTFIEAGLPQDFIKQLRDAADSLVALVSDRKQRAADRGAATNLLTTQIRDARNLVKVLDGFVKTAAKDDPKLLVTWKILKRLPQPATPTPVAASPSTSTGAAA